MTNSDSPKQTKIALNLLGGGVTGAFFHYGVMAAIDDHLSRKTIDFDIYVGASAGSLVATSCAIGLSPQQVVEAILKEDTRFYNIERKDIYRFSALDMSKEVLKFFWTLFYITYLKIEHPEEAPSYFWGLKDALPGGLFSMRYYEAWVKRVFEQNNLPLFFTQVKKEIYIPAYDLDTCRRVVFGRHPFRHIPFSKAISASSAIPIFFNPVEIEDRHYVDGGLGEVAHMDLAASAGAQLIILVNPMVPLHNDMNTVKIKTVFEEKGRIRDKGLTYIYDQNLRAEIRLRTHAAMHAIGFMYPGVDVLLIEPDDLDPTMFLFNPMDLEARKQIVEFAYNLTRQKLRQNAELWKRTLDRHQITVAGV